jgi:hypothetical protein
MIPENEISHTNEDKNNYHLEEFEESPSVQKRRRKTGKNDEIYIKSDFLTSDFKDVYFRGKKTARKNIKKYLIYPEDQFKGKWDLWITLYSLLQ